MDALLNCTVMLLILLNLKGSHGYSAPDDCEWIEIDENEVSLTCHLQTIVATGILTTNFSLIQSDSTSSLTIICDSHLFESHLAPNSFVHLWHLKRLNIIQCKLKDLLKDTFAGLNNLRNILIQSVNEEFPLNVETSIFDHLQQLETINLAFNKIQILSDSTICHLNLLKVLNISHNELTSIITHNISSFESRNCVSSLSELDVSFNKISFIAHIDIQRFQKLRILNLSHNNINKIDPLLFEGFENLQILDLSFNQLTNIPSSLFQDSPDLRQIYIQNNFISVLPFGLFNGLQQLQFLNLSSNHLSSVFSSDVFIDLTRLVVLDISKNELTYINRTFFQSLYSLQMLLLSSNKIHLIEENSFISLNNLYTLDFSNNHIEYFDISSLNGLYVLSNLKLSFNSIHSFHLDTFQNCSTLDALYLQGNNLSSVPLALRVLQFLKSLDLSDNKIANLDNTPFLMMKQLQYFSLSQNALGNLTRKTFSWMVAVKKLDLSKNRICNLEHSIFDVAHSLSYINLSDNCLTDINGLFMNLKNLKLLNVSRNKISWFDYALIPVEMEVLDLHSNEIKILGNYYELESALQLQEIDISFNHLTEINGASFSNKIRIIKINNNKINTVNPFTFTAKSNLTSVNMSNNDIKYLDSNTFRLNREAFKKPLPLFAIAGNPFFCNCDTEWLLHMNKPDTAIHYPRLIDFDTIVCSLSFARPYSTILLSKAKSSDFLCKYGSHCFALCHCCEFDACDCEMVCPEECRCFSDQTWNTNIVDCSSQGFSSVPSVIPMDVTDLYLDGNNIIQLTSHAFIGRKNMKAIFLNDSNIHSINNRTFNGLSILQKLHLENNLLNSLNGYEFEALVNLEELYLSNNRIIFIANITFQNLKMLKVLHINKNFLKEFQVWNLNWNLLLKNVLLSDNPWYCKCDYLEMYNEWLSSSSSIVQDLTKIQCHYNQSSRLYLTAYNVSYCLKTNYINYFEITFHIYYIVIPLVLIVLVLLIICLCRKNIKIWLFTKYGIQLSKKSNLSPESEKLFDAFVSYCKNDETFVSQILVPELECGTPSYHLCLRSRDLPLSEAVTEAIECSHRTLVVLSKNYLLNEWCRFELKSAYHESRCDPQHKIIIALIGTISIDADAKQCFSNAHIIRWGEKRFWQKLRYAMPINNQRMV